MAVNPYTLNNLYQQGILDYVPTDLCSGVNVSALTPTMNPYLQSAMQGGLYQNYNVGNDSYTSSVNLNGEENQSQAGWNAFGMQGVGTNCNSVGNSFGMQGVGTNCNSVGNSFGMQGVGTNCNSVGNSLGLDGRGLNSNASSNALGTNDIGIKNSSSLANLTRNVNAIPKAALGLVSAALIVATTMLCFKKGKKAPVTQKSSFFSKLQFWKKKS